MNTLYDYEQYIMTKGKKLNNGDLLLPGSTATNFVYKLFGHTLTEHEKRVFNKYERYQDKFTYLDTLGVKINIVGADSGILDSNLMLIDVQMPIIIGSILENFYRGAANRVSELTKLCIAQNICNAPEINRDVFYAYKVKDLLTGTALGMMPTAVWNGNYEATGIVKDNGDILCYHIYNRNDFREYLYNNTCLEIPSNSECDFGFIEDTYEGQILKLNLQIRLIK